MTRTKGAKNLKDKSADSIRFNHSVFRLVISYIQGYGIFKILPKGTIRAKDVSPRLDNLKHRVLDRLLQQQSKRPSKPTNWSIAWEVHPGSGLPHLDILIVYQRNVRLYLNSYDYLIKELDIKQSVSTQSFQSGHVWVTPYSSRKFSAAILHYGFKQDPDVVTNLTELAKSQIVQVNLLKADPYSYLYDRMKEDPLHFNLQQYVQKHQLSKHIGNWSGIKTKLKDMQLAAANLSLKDRPGFKFIDRALIESRLSSAELQTYDSWSGYQTIVNYLNQMITYKGNRQQKSLNLLITGAPNTGKSALVWQRNPLAGRAAISNFCSIYPIGMTTWFPKYQSDVYSCIYWNEAKLTSYSYDTILKLLDGSPLDLTNKGSISRKIDNPLIIMTSNLTLQQMIQQKFSHNRQYQKMARENLAVRVQNVIVPEGLTLFLLQKLLVPN